MKAHEIALGSLAEIDARIEAWKQFGYPHPAACNCSPCIHERRVVQTEKDIAEFRDALHEITERDWEAPRDKRNGPRMLFMAFTLGAAVLLAIIAACIYYRQEKGEFMPRKRRPVQMPIAEATECVIWRARILLESVEAATTTKEAATRLRVALDDYTASKGDPIIIYRCNACSGPCTQRFDGMCTRCYEKSLPVNRTLTFAELQS